MGIFREMYIFIVYSLLWDIIIDSGLQTMLQESTCPRLRILALLKTGFEKRKTKGRDREEKKGEKKTSEIKREEEEEEERKRKKKVK